MFEIIVGMIQQAEKTNNYDLLDSVKELISQFAYTYNCPSNWRNIGEELAEIFQDNQWVYDGLELWNHE